MLFLKSNGLQKLDGGCEMYNGGARPNAYGTGLVVNVAHQGDLAGLFILIGLIQTDGVDLNPKEAQGADLAQDSINPRRDGNVLPKRATDDAVGEVGLAPDIWDCVKRVAGPQQRMSVQKFELES